MPLFGSKKKAAAEAEAAAAAAAEGEGGKKKKLTRAQKEKLEKEVRRAPQRPQRFACASHAPCAQANEPPAAADARKSARAAEGLPARRL